MRGSKSLSLHPIVSFPLSVFGSLCPPRRVTSPCPRMGWGCGAYVMGEIDTWPSSRPLLQNRTFSTGHPFSSPSSLRHIPRWLVSGRPLFQCALLEYGSYWESYSRLSCSVLPSMPTAAMTTLITVWTILRQRSRPLLPPHLNPPFDLLNCLLSLYSPNLLTIHIVH